MAAMWPLSRTKEFDLNGDPIVGAKAYFYDVGTTTPQTVYSDATLSNAYTTDSPVETDGYGRWPAVYLSPDPGSYRQRVTDDDDVVLFDDDDIDVPQAADYVPPDEGEVGPEYLFQTGDFKFRDDDSPLPGYVRGNGQTIGSATSGASERANADCQALFLYFWEKRPGLAVSGGRGSNAASDWAANKTIATPNWQHRTPVGVGAMGGATNPALIPNELIDGDDDNETIGATFGEAEHTLVPEEIPEHDHNPELTDPGHNHTTGNNTSGPIGSGYAYVNTAVGGANTGNATTGITLSMDAIGGDEPHNNLQPGMFVAVFYKL